MLHRVLAQAQPTVLREVDILEGMQTPCERTLEKLTSRSACKHALEKLTAWSAHKRALEKLTSQLGDRYKYL